MAIYIRRLGEIADGSITTAKLADGAVIEQKLAGLAVSTSKLQNQAVTLAKAQQALKIHHFVGDETEVSTLGVTEEDQKLFKVPIATADDKGMHPSRIHVNAEMKVIDGVSPIGILKLYFNDEVTPRITLNTTNDSYEMQEGDADISDISPGAQNVKITLATDDASATVYNDLIEIFFEK